MTEKRKFAVSSAESAPNTAPILLKNDIVSNLKEAALIGFQGLEVHMRETTLLDYEEIAKVSAAYGIEISAVVTGRLNTQGMVNLMDDRPYITDSAMKGMSKFIEMASRLKTDLVVGWLRGNIPNGASPKPYMERLAQNLGAIGEEASAKGVKLFIEVINRYEINTFNTARETIEFLNTWEIPNCYIHLDTFHMNIDEADPIEAIRQCGDRLGYVHVADNTRCYPGTGTLNFKSYLEVLDEINYEGYISVECLPKPDGKTAAQKALEYLRQL